MSPRYPGGPRPSLRMPNQPPGSIPGSQPLLPNSLDPTRPQGTAYNNGVKAPSTVIGGPNKDVSKAIKYIFGESRISLCCSTSLAVSFKDFFFTFIIIVFSVHDGKINVAPSLTQFVTVPAVWTGLPD